MTFAGIARSHRLLEELFLRFQEAVLDREWPTANALLATFRERLAAHVALEDALLPILLRAEPVRGGTPEVYGGEHRKLVELCDGLAAAVARGGDRRAAIAVLEASYRVKGLHEHHVDREEAKLLPFLDAVATDHERAVLSAFEAEEGALRALLA